MKMKRTLAIVVVLATILSCTAYAAEAGIEASKLIDSYNIEVYPQGNGKLLVVASISGTTRVETIGFPSIQLFDNSGSLKADAYGKYTYNAGSHSYSFIYNGTAGTKYYAEATFYAYKDNESDERGGSSSIVTAT